MNWLPITIFIILQVLDVWTTYILLRRQGFIEINPLLRRLIGKIGIFPTLFVSKVVVIAAIIAVTLLLAIHWWTWALYALCVFYVVVVFNNIKHMR